ncbi:hypothetical protein Tco_1136615 [Tanacetum coccineum]
MRHEYFLASIINSYESRLTAFSLSCLQFMNCADHKSPGYKELGANQDFKEFDLLKWDQQVVSELVKNMFLLEDMDQDFAHVVAASKVPMLKPDKARRRLAVKARSTLMMGIPNEHQLKFNSIKDAKKLLEAVEKRFGRNEATKKTQNNLLKQQYENFTAPSSEMLDQTFDRLQKLVINTTNGVSIASTQVNVVNSTNIDNLSDAVIYDMEEMDLRWQMAMLTIRTRRFLKNTGRKVFEEGFDGLGGYDWSDQAEEGPNYALVAFSSSNPDLEVSNDSV